MRLIGIDAQFLIFRENIKKLKEENSRLKKENEELIIENKCLKEEIKDIAKKSIS